MAEIILPPEENEETPQAPELNIDKPTENSKVITIEFEAKKTNKVSTKDTNQQLYTTDTDAWFEFKETSLEGANGTYSVVFRNRHDGSIFQRTGDVVNGVAYYKIPHQEIRHAGAWRGQIVYTLSNGDTTAQEFGYDVQGHILDGKDVREIVVEDFETLMSQLRSMKDSAEQELADLVNTANQNETDRQVFFDDLVEDIDDLQANYQELLDTGVLQTNINQKLAEAEQEYAPRLTELEQNDENLTAQLAQTVRQGENESITKAMLSQEIKEDLNNGEIEFILNTSEIEDGSVTYGKTESYIKDRLKDIEYLVGSEAFSYLDKISFNLEDYDGLTSVPNVDLEVLSTPAPTTGLLTVHFIAGFPTDSRFFIMDRTEEPLSSPSAFKIVSEIPFQTTEVERRKPVMLKTDKVIEKGQYLAVDEGSGIYGQTVGLSNRYIRRMSGGDYISGYSNGRMFYGQIGGNPNVIEDMQNQLRNITTEGNVTVKTFGAKGDGVTDDTLALQNAMSALAGAEVIIPKGDYLVTGTILIPSNTTVRGYGKESRIVLIDGYSLEKSNSRLSADTIVKTVPNSEGITVQNLMIESEISEQGDRMYGLLFENTKNGLIENVHIHNINYFPENFTADSSGGSSYNLCIAKSENIRVNGGTFENASYECLGVYDDCKNIIIDGVYTGSAWRCSLQIHRGCENIKVINSTINQQSPWASAGLTTHGIPGKEVKNVVIDNNTIYATQREVPEQWYNAVIQLMDGEMGESYRITNNHIRGKRKGIQTMISMNNVISGNDIEVEEGRAIDIASGFAESIIANNVVRSPVAVNHSNNTSTLVINNIGIENHIPVTE